MKKINRLHSALMIASLAFALAQTAHADPEPNLVQNGDFETGDFSGWDQSGVLGWASLDGAHSGNYGWDEGAVGAPHFLSQTLATTAGSDYTIDFWLKAYGGPHSQYIVTWGGKTIYDVINAVGPNDWEEISLNEIATSDATVISFGIRQDTGYTDLDDITVVDPVPDAASTSGLLGLALGGLALLRRKLA